MNILTPPNNALNLKAFYTWMGTDGICRTVTKPMAEVNLDEAMENSAAVTSFFKNRKFPLLIDSRNIKYMSREARKYFSTNGRDTKINCFAVLVKSPISRVIGNFFMGLNKPEVPARLFDSEADAVTWLKQYL